MEESKKVEKQYANALTVANSLFDFTLSFKEETFTDGNPEKKEISEVAMIKISPQLAKALVKLLKNNIESYEKLYGAIPEIVRGSKDE